MSLLSATVTTETAVSQKVAFEHIVPIDLTTIFTGYGPLPAVIGIENQTGDWDAAGQTRLVLLSDGSAAQESLTKYEHPHYFSYTVSDFTGALGYLASSANGEWWFSGVHSGITLIKWRYTFNAKSTFTAPILWIITQVLWRGYMTRALRLSIEQIKNGVI
jgi:hypothetical protein